MQISFFVPFSPCERVHPRYHFKGEKEREKKERKVPNCEQKSDIISEVMSLCYLEAGPILLLFFSLYTSVNIDVAGKSKKVWPARVHH